MDYVADTRKAVVNVALGRFDFFLQKNVVFLGIGSVEGLFDAFKKYVEGLMAAIFFEFGVNFLVYDSILYLAED